MRDYSEILEVKEVFSAKEANDHIETGEWMLLKLVYEMQLCYKKVIVGENNFEKLQPYDKLCRVCVLGRIPKTATPIPQREAVMESLVIPNRCKRSKKLADK